MNYSKMTVISKSCGHCKVRRILRVSTEGYKRWMSGELIQTAFPDVSTADRETLISGICPGCWEKVFGPEEGE